ncbi:HpcH/HpaI aldolase family protein [Hydrogenophaga sp.]|uniref:HpcH/HpaI aldolase family protein n=1 Tax=Hydrogenophaga sp. TaxID=1904254 RepID=UPI003D0C3A90
MNSTRTLQKQPTRYQVGTFVKTASPHVVEVLGTTGLDFAVLDAEHAPLDRAALDLMMLAGRAAGLPLLVRIPDREAATVLSVLDMGAAGLLVPHVDTAEQARAVVAHARYRGGDRGYSGSPRAAGYGTLGMKQALAQGNQTLVMCQIESPEAVRNAAAIAAVDGVDGLFIGRADLALAMGLDDSKHADVSAATDQSIAAALAADKLAGVFTASVDERDRYAAAGVRWFVFGSDQSFMRQGAQAVAHPGA